MKKHLGWMVAAACLTLAPQLASATVYSFQDTEVSALSPSPVTFAFSLDTATALASASGTTFNGVTIDENGTTSAGNSLEASFTTDLASSLFFWVDTSTTPFYTGTGTGLTFNTGTFAIADGLTDGEGTLTITSASSTPVSPTPEPATWMLLLTGGAMAVVARRSVRKPSAAIL